MKFALHTSTAISSVLKEPEHFYVDIYYLIILIIVAFTLLLLSFLRYLSPQWRPGRPFFSLPTML